MSSLTWQQSDRVGKRTVKCAQLLNQLVFGSAAGTRPSSLGVRHKDDVQAQQQQDQAQSRWSRHGWEGSAGLQQGGPIERAGASEGGPAGGERCLMTRAAS